MAISTTYFMRTREAHTEADSPVSTDACVPTLFQTLETIFSETL